MSGRLCLADVFRRAAKEIPMKSEGGLPDEKNSAQH
jgi:hypothetical protein